MRPATPLSRSCHALNRVLDLLLAAVYVSLVVVYNQQPAVEGRKVAVMVRSRLLFWVDTWCGMTFDPVLFACGDLASARREIEDVPA